MIPIDWHDLQIRLDAANLRIRKLTVEVQALREIVVEQALEIQRLNHVTTLPVERTGNGTADVATNDE
jgi:aminopeptidase N